MPQPALMAIGDSLFNGVRSLTINGVMAQWSAPAQLAKALGVQDFAVPDYPRNVALNFENWVSKILNIPNILKDIDDNVAFWNTTPPSPSGAKSFDNIAIASAVYSDLYLRTANMAQGEISKINARIAANQATNIDSLRDFFFAFNTRFLLNPSGDPNFENLTPLKLVGAREPKRLIVSIGHNNGLWDMAFGAQPCAGLWAKAPLFGPDDKTQLDTLLAQLLALPASIGNIYLNALPHPGCPAALMPIPGGKYENRFGFTYGVLTDAQVAKNDQIIDELNAYIAAKTKGTRIHIVPVDKVLDAYDFKRNPQAKTVPTPDGRSLTNLMIDETWDGDDDMQWSGGLMGLDGMHLTFVGYNIMAKAILDVMQAVEGDGVKQGDLPSVDEALAADKLLSKFPNTWDEVMNLWLGLRKAEAGAAADAEAAQAVGHPSADSVRTLMQCAQFRTGGAAAAVDAAA